MTITIYNLILHKGATYQKAFTFARWLQVVEQVAGGIKIEPLAMDLPAGTEIEFDRGKVMLSADYRMGDRVVQLVPYGFIICPGEKAPVGAIDFTGFTFESSIRRTYDDPEVLAEITVANPAVGLIQLSIDYQTTSAIAANITYDRLPKKLQTIEVQPLSGKHLPYVWQLFGLKNGVRDRLMEGKVWVTP